MGKFFLNFIVLYSSMFYQEISINLQEYITEETICGSQLFTFDGKNQIKYLFISNTFIHDWIPFCYIYNIRLFKNNYNQSHFCFGFKTNDSNIQKLDKIIQELELIKKVEVITFKN